MTTTTLLIDGVARGASNGATFERRNPLDGEVATRAPAATPADAVAAVEAAAEGVSRLVGDRPVAAPRAPHEGRPCAGSKGRRVRRRRRRGDRRLGAVGRLQRPSRRRHADRGGGDDDADFAARSSRPTYPGSLAMGVRQPAGVVLGMAPWNAPIILGVRAVAMPLACGNTVVLKGSELCPATHGLIVEAFQDAGFPDGVVNYITNAPADAGAVVEAMVAHPAVRARQFHRLDARRQDHRADSAPNI